MMDTPENPMENLLEEPNQFDPKENIPELDDNFESDEDDVQQAFDDTDEDTNEEPVIEAKFSDVTYLMSLEDGVTIEDDTEPDDSVVPVLFLTDTHRPEVHHLFTDTELDESNGPIEYSKYIDDTAMSLIDDVNGTVYPVSRMVMLIPVMTKDGDMCLALTTNGYILNGVFSDYREWAGVHFPKLEPTDFIEVFRNPVEDQLLFDVVGKVFKEQGLSIIEDPDAWES